MERIVVIHAGAIGDLVQALPTMRAVRETWPGAHVTLIGRPERAALARLAGLVDAVADLETCGLWRLTGETPSAAQVPPAIDGADLVVDFLTQGALGRGLERAGGGTRRQVITAAPLPPEDWDRPAAAWILQQVSARLPLRRAADVPEIPLAETSVEAARVRLAARGVAGGFVAIHPGSGSARKNWPADRFAEVASRVRDTARRQVAWLAGPAELERRTLPPAAGRDTVLADLALDEAAGVLALADAYVGNDSGITQIAAAVRRPDGRATPTVALFGPTDPRVWAPRGDHVRVMSSADRAMEGLDAGEVLDTVLAVLP